MMARTAIADGISASAAFIGAQGAKIFVTRTSPDAGPTARVVLCQPIGGEAARNYRREVLLARRLASFGIEAVRFHYRGSGHSDPSPCNGFRSMVDDAQLVRDHLDDDLPVAWMGTRLGGAVAGIMAGADPGSPLAIWDPVLDPASYFRDILRALVFSAFKRDEVGAAPKSDLVRELRAAGSLDLLGYPISAGMLDEISSSAALAALPVDGRRILLAELRRRGDPRTEIVRLGAAWERAGASVRVMGVTLYEPWWYGARSGAIGDERSEANQRLIEVTAEFLAGVG